MRIPIILASASPRRRDLLAELRVPFIVSPSEVDETPRRGELPADLVRRLARSKAMRTFAFQRASIVLAADTVVALEDVVFGKPVDREDGRSMLQRLAGREHRVLTGFCVMAPGGEMVDEVVETLVRFRKLDDAEIDAYLDSGEPFDKACAYAIQGGAGTFVVSIEGSYSNVVGLPQDEVAAVLGRFISLPARDGAAPT